MINKFRGRYYFLSNFYPCRVVIGGLAYPSSEHAYQASKSCRAEIKAEIATLKTPGKAKRAGRSIELKSDWDSTRVQTMKHIVTQKFIQNPYLLRELVATGEEELIEGNNWGDRFWGVCSGIGENNLGKILMQIRCELKSSI